MPPSIKYGWYSTKLIQHLVRVAEAKGKAEETIGVWETIEGKKVEVTTVTNSLLDKPTHWGDEVFKGVLIRYIGSNPVRRVEDFYHTLIRVPPNQVDRIPEFFINFRAYHPPRVAHEDE